MLMRGSANDWLQSHIALSGGSGSIDMITRAFRDNYFRSPELRCTDAGAMWQEIQKADKRVEEYVSRMRKIATRLKFDEQVLHLVIINGLRPAVRTHAVQQGVWGLEEIIRAAKIAEAAATGSIDPTAAALVETMKASMRTIEQQAAQIQQLTSKVSTWTNLEAQSPPPRDTAGRSSGWSTRRLQVGGRAVKPTPQNLQRANYACQQAAGLRPEQRQTYRRTDRLAETLAAARAG